MRSAVVLLHATLEDLLREAIRSRPSLDNEKFIKSLMLEADGNKNRAKERFGIIDLLEHKDLAVSEILNKSISHHLDRRSFNHIGDVKEALIQIGVSHAEFKVLLPVIGKAIERRHKIVHRSDRTEHSEKTHGPPTTIGKLTVEEWTKSIGRFGVLLLRELKEKQPPAPLQLKQQA